MNKQPCEVSSFDYDRLLTEEEGAKILSTTPASLKQARHLGLLFGKPAPKFVKLGRSARYKLSELLKFRDQFPEFTSTSEYSKELKPAKAISKLPEGLV